jgi:DNA-binding response OmpR family regulator
MDILIAEDDWMSLKLLNNILVKHGHRVLAATNGQEAWDIFQHETIPMVITDWLMPKMNGLELCQNIRGTQKETYTYIIVSTIRNEKGDLMEVLKHGADDYILKPIHVDELLARIKTGERIMKLEKKHIDMEQCIIESRTFCWLTMNSQLPNRSSARFKIKIPRSGCYISKY